MDNNIVTTVYTVLKDGTTKIGKSAAELDELETKIKSGRYSAQALRDEIYPARDRLKAKIRDDSAETIRVAKSHIEQYRQDAARLNDLDPNEITDDLKLMQSGISLRPNDIQAILRRNANNRTMLQLTLRYAAEHNIDTNGTFYIGGEAELENAKNLDGIVNIYADRIRQPDALELLDRFFNIDG